MSATEIDTDTSLAPDNWMSKYLTDGVHLVRVEKFQSVGKDFVDLLCKNSLTDTDIVVRTTSIQTDDDHKRPWRIVTPAPDEDL
jgi:hypothetical protein